MGEDKKKLLKETIKILSLVISGCMMTILIILLVLYLLTPPTFFNIYSNGFNKIYYLKNQNDPSVITIAGMCNKFEDNKEKVICVHRIVENLHKYYITPIVRTPTEILNDSGDCWDYSNLYCTIFKKMNLNCEITVVPPDNGKDGHSFSVVNVDNTWVCILDQTHMYCWDGGDTQNKDPENDGVKEWWE